MSPGVGVGARLVERLWGAGLEERGVWFAKEQRKGKLGVGVDG